MPAFDSLKQRIEVLERKLALQERLLSANASQAARGSERSIRLAKTVSGPGYPEDPNPEKVYPIAFVDGSFPMGINIAGPTFLEQSADYQTYACYLGSEFLPNGSGPFEVFNLNGQWFIPALTETSSGTPPNIDITVGLIYLDNNVPAQIENSQCYYNGYLIQVNPIATQTVSSLCGTFPNNTTTPIYVYNLPHPARNSTIPYQFSRYVRKGHYLGWKYCSAMTINGVTRPCYFLLDRNDYALQVQFGNLYLNMGANETVTLSTLSGGPDPYGHIYGASFSSGIITLVDYEPAYQVDLQLYVYTLSGTHDIDIRLEDLDTAGFLPFQTARYSITTTPRLITLQGQRPRTTGAGNNQIRVRIDTFTGGSCVTIPLHVMTNHVRLTRLYD